MVTYVAEETVTSVFIFPEAGGSWFLLIDYRYLGRGHTKETGNCNATAICDTPFSNILYVQLRLITIIGNCGCVVVASFLGVPSSLEICMIL
jgi:hypothetical protein